MNRGLKLFCLSIASILLLACQSCWADGGKIELMHELVDFPFDHNTLPPDYLEMIKSPQTDMRRVAASLMERKKQFITRWEDPSQYETEENFPKTANDFELICIFPEQYLDSLMQKGQLNVHQVGHSRGVCEPAIRAHAEDFMIGIHLESKYDGNPDSRLHLLRPKYGYVNLFKPCGIKVNPFRLLQYGQVLIVYNDEVKQRSSFTYGDSLASYCEPWAITMRPLDPTPLTLLRPPDERKGEASNCRYIEAQIWGPIDLSDIKEFRIPKERKDLLTKLASSGKPVFSYDREKMELNDNYIDICDCGWLRGEALNKAAVEELKKEKVAQKP